MLVVITGPELLPTMFVSNTNSGDTGMLALRNTGGRGRVAPSELDPPRPTLSRSTFATQTAHGVKAIDLLKTSVVSADTARWPALLWNSGNLIVVKASLRGDRFTDPARYCQQA
ncbi:hypothetical protein TSOC_001416 [Tetrabaena socialis]|uniref:Uncharacterized protein n=1 Tax=Tetrabaena socialis TaxID=47790 RepID=A0A2J8AGS5_9CHLO|nr:hypothetical protein TSOC_001416 [Tetrabaena socialis]|eukprot:PNH11712.1 hypothetical protein TSOC_001416 [Tetrabaena socialis]